MRWSRHLQQEYGDLFYLSAPLLFCFRLAHDEITLFLARDRVSVLMATKELLVKKVISYYLWPTDFSSHDHISSHMLL